MQDQIIIKDLLVRSIIGINPEERVKKQDILINMILFADISRAAQTDDIADAVNYKEITKRVIDHVEKSSNFLVEKLVSDIAQIVLTEFEVSKIRVRVEKPGALRFAQSVGIEIERSRESFQSA